MDKRRKALWTICAIIVFVSATLQIVYYAGYSLRIKNWIQYPGERTRIDDCLVVTKPRGWWKYSDDDTSLWFGWGAFRYMDRSNHNIPMPKLFAISFLLYETDKGKLLADRIPEMDLSEKKFEIVADEYIEIDREKAELYVIRMQEDGQEIYRFTINVPSKKVKIFGGCFRRSVIEDLLSSIKWITDTL